MSKKTWILIGCLVLSLTLGLGGSLAYLTDSDTKVNTFTMGGVNIKVEENFDEDNAQLVPGKDIVKEAWIVNTGANNAYVWMTIALPKVLEGATTDSAADNIVHINTPGAFWYGYHTTQKYIDSAKAKYSTANQTGYPVPDTHTWIIDKATTEGIQPVEGQTVTIGGVEYWVMTYLYNKALVPGEVTNLAISKVYLDSHVDFEWNATTNKYDYYYIDKGVETTINYDLSDVDIIVTGYAIQADGFSNVREAYDAFMGQWTSNGAYTEDLMMAATATPIPSESPSANADPSVSPSPEATNPAPTNGQYGDE